MTLPGLHALLRFEAVLGPKHKAAALTEYCVPVIQCGRSQQQRALFLGWTRSVYTKRLAEIRERLAAG